jgi:5-methylcytosine-specific restriction endonuclease McrA
LRRASGRILDTTTLNKLKPFKLGTLPPKQTNSTTYKPPKVVDPAYNNRRWQAIRNATLNREPLCRHCAALGFTTAAKMVDHILPIKQGGTSEPSNLQPLCWKCHARKTAKDAIDFGTGSR